MRYSTTLPQFQPDPRRAVDAARRAEREGLDGVFVYDHLWPLGRPVGSPSAECFTLLSAIAAATARIRVGTLVIRAGLRAHDVVIDALRTVADIAPGRLVVGLGIGDHLSQEENTRFGIPYPPAVERLGEARRLAEALMAEGIEVWIGGRGLRVRQMCAELGLTWNAWGGTDAELRVALDEVPQEHVTWGGDDEPPPFTVPVEEIVSTKARLLVD